MKISIKDFLRKCDQFCSFLRIWSHLLKKSLMGNFIFCAEQILKDYLKAFNNEFLWLMKHFLEKMLLQVYRKVCFRATIVFHIYQQPIRHSNINYHGYTMFFLKLILEIILNLTLLRLTPNKSVGLPMEVLV